MQLTMTQAAAAFGKTRRQLVYLIEQGRLPAEKIGGRWFIDSATIAADPAAAQRGQARQGRLRDAIEDALLPAGKERRYSMRDLKAFQIAEPVYRQLIAQPGSDHPATEQWRECLRQLAVGCHLGYPISRAGIAPSRKLRRRLPGRLRRAAARGEEALVRSIRSYRGLLLFPYGG